MALFQRASVYGLVFNKQKCIIKSGTRPDPEWTAAISRIPPPTNITTLRNFLGIATYMSPFTTNMTNLISPIQNLTHKYVIFVHHSVSISHTEQTFLKQSHSIVLQSEIRLISSVYIYFDQLYLVYYSRPLSRRNIPCLACYVVGYPSLNRRGIKFSNIVYLTIHIASSILHNYNYKIIQ